MVWGKVTRRRYHWPGTTRSVEIEERRKLHLFLNSLRTNKPKSKRGGGLPPPPLSPPYVHVWNAPMGQRGQQKAKKEESAEAGDASPISWESISGKQVLSISHSSGASSLSHSLSRSPFLLARALYCAIHLENTGKNVDNMRTGRFEFHEYFKIIESNDKKLITLLSRAFHYKAWKWGNECIPLFFSLPQCPQGMSVLGKRWLLIKARRPLFLHKEPFLYFPRGTSRPASLIVFVSPVNRGNVVLLNVSGIYPGYINFIAKMGDLAILDTSFAYLDTS